MNDGGEWKELRSWMLRTMRVFGFGKREMAQMIRKELTLLLNEMNTEGPHKLRPLITPTVINVLWFLTTGESFSRGERYINTRVLLDFSTLCITVFTYSVSHAYKRLVGIVYTFA